MSCAPFVGVEGIYQADGERLTLVLIDVVSETIAVIVGQSGLR